MLYSISDYIRFFKHAKNRIRSDKDYLKFESLQARFVIKFLEKQGINLKGLRVLDIGSGRGGYSKEFAKKGAKVTAIDIRDYIFLKIKNIEFIICDASKMPFEDSSFDFVFSNVPQN